MSDICKQEQNNNHFAREQRLVKLAKRQRGVASSRQFQDLGFSRSGISERVRVGKLHKVYAGVYAVGHDYLSRESKWMAAVLSKGNGTVLSHSSAAQLWNFWTRGPTEIHVTVPRQTTPVRALVVHRSKTLRKKDCQIRLGIPVTSPARTLLDLGNSLTKYQLTNMIKQADYRNRYNRSEVDKVIQLNLKTRAATVLRQAITLYDNGSAGTRSDLEDAFLAEVLREGLTEPLVNVKVHTNQKSYEVDLVWPADRVCVEVDGRPHDLPDVQREDAIRTAALRDAGYTVIRCRANEFDAKIRHLKSLLM